MFDGGSDLRDPILTFLDDACLAKLIADYLKKDQMEDGENLMTRRYLMCYLLFKNVVSGDSSQPSPLRSGKSYLPTKTGEDVYVYNIYVNPVALYPVNPVAFCPTNVNPVALYQMLILLPSILQIVSLLPSMNVDRYGCTIKQGNSEVQTLLLQSPTTR